MRRTINSRILHVSGMVASLAFTALMFSCFIVKGQEASAPELIIQSEHTMPVTAVAYSPQGDRIASAGEDFTIKLWDARSGLLIKTFAGHSAIVNSIAFSFDGTMLVSGSNDGTVRLWDLVNCQFIRAYTGHTSRVNTVAFSRNQKMIASGGGLHGEASDYSVRIWDSQSERQLQRLEGHHTARVLSLSFSPDDESLVSGGEDGTAVIWSTRTGAVKRIFDAEDESYISESESVKRFVPVLFVGFSPDGSSVARGTDDAVKIWDLRSGQLIHTIKDKDNSFSSIAFGSDWRHLLTAGGYAGQLKLWELATERVVSSTEFGGENITTLSLSSDGRNFVTGNGNSNVSLWKTDRLTKYRTLGITPDPVRVTTFSPSGNTIAWASGLTINIWDRQQGRMLKQLKGQTSAVGSLAFSPDGKYLVSCDDVGGVFVWNLDTGKQSRTLGAPGEVSTVAFSRDGKIVASSALNGSGNLLINLWDWRTGRRLKTLPVPSPYSSPVSPESKKPRASHAPGGEDSIFSISFSPDNERLAAGTSFGTLCVWNLRTGRVQVLKEHNFSVTSVDFSPDGGKIVSSGANIKVWNVGASKSTMTLDKHTDYVNVVKFGPDGKTIASASNDRTIKIWDPESGRIVHELSDHFSGVNSVNYSRDGKFLVSGSEDATVKIWSTSTGKLLTSMIAFNNSWIAYTPDGYFSAADPDNQYVAWRSGNQISTSSAKLKGQFYRPDLVARYSRGLVQPMIASTPKEVNVPVKRSEEVTVAVSEGMLRDRWKKMRFYALVIGNGVYKSKILGTLQSPIKNAEDIARILEQEYGFKVDPLYNASRLEILGALEDLARRPEINDDASLIIYYTGHGTYSDDTSVAFWQPSDADPNLPGTWISADDVINRIRGIKARHILIISDSCFAGGFFDEKLGGRSQLEEPVRYLMDSMEHPSRTMMTSAAKQFIDADGPEEHTIFTYGLWLALRDSVSNIFTAEQIYSKVRTFVINNNSSQRPKYDPIPNSMRSPANPGEFVFVRKR